jgi:RNase P/RNase MRP subunit p30
MRSFFIGKRNKKIEKKALALGLNIVFLKKISNVNELNTKKDSKNYNGILIKNQSVDMMRRIIDKSQNFFKEIIVLGMNDEINRACLEHKKTTALASPEYNRKKDYNNYRNSGLNQVLCKIAKQNNKTIIENFSDLNTAKKSKALILGRMLQNVRLCKKYKVKFILTNVTNKVEELKSNYEFENFKKIIRQ